jgi:hypothetical protein
MGMTNLTIGEKGGLYKVSINGYATEEAAKAAAAGVQNVAPEHGCLSGDNSIEHYIESLLQTRGLFYFALDESTNI